jgi:hypothetical protein
MAATAATVARAAGIHPKTVRGLISGKHWPTDAVQSSIEAVLGWREGEIVARAAGESGSLDDLTDVEVAAELHRRLAERERRVTQFRASSGR